MTSKDRWKEAKSRGEKRKRVGKAVLDGKRETRRERVART